MCVAKRKIPYTFFFFFRNHFSDGAHHRLVFLSFIEQKWLQPKAHAMSVCLVFRLHNELDKTIYASPGC